MENMDFTKQLKRIFSPKELKELEVATFETIVKLAIEGNPKAQFHLGGCYFLGKYVKKNIDRAFYWFDKSAEQGDVNAGEILKLWAKTWNEQRSTQND